MATQTDFRVEGLAELKRQLQELPAKVEGNIMRGALTAALKVLRREALANVPEKSGDLKRSIKIKFDRKSLKRGFVNGYLTAGDKTAYYAHMIEFGTASFYTGKGKSVGRAYSIVSKQKGGSLVFGGQSYKSVIHQGVRPKPFMRPAVDGSADEAIKAMGSYIAQRLPKEFAKAGK
jgi:HK97 gp10 family phage protein